MIVSAWKNGKFENRDTTFGIRVSIQDRNRYFKREWKSVILDLERYPRDIETNIAKDSFWGPRCLELINKGIGIWLRQNGLAPWPKGKPPKLMLEHIKENRFRLYRRERPNSYRRDSL